MARVNRKEQRQLKREIRSMTYRAKQGSGEKETARRVSQMVHEQLKPDNGVVQQFDTLVDASRGILQSARVFHKEDRDASEG